MLDYRARGASGVAAVDEQLRGRSGEAAGDLPGRLKCSILLAGARALALGLLAPAPPVLGTVIGLVDFLLARRRGDRL